MSDAGFLLIDGEAFDEVARKHGAITFAVLAYLHKCAGKRGTCNPSQVDVAATLKIGERSVRYAIQQLIDDKIIGVATRGRANEYRVLNFRKYLLGKRTPAPGAAIDSIPAPRAAIDREYRHHVPPIPAPRAALRKRNKEKE